MRTPTVCCDSISHGELISRSSPRPTSTKSPCGSINARARPWASKRQPIDYKRCCTDRLNSPPKADIGPPYPNRLFCLFQGLRLNRYDASILASGHAMRRCDFIVGMASSSLAWPLALRAQQSDKPVIGFIGLAPFAPMQDYLAGFRLGLKGEGFVEGENVVVEYRSA